MCMPSRQGFDVSGLRLRASTERSAEVRSVEALSRTFAKKAQENRDGHSQQAIFPLIPWRSFGCTQDKPLRLCVRWLILDKV